jgi:small subunit ribosomal protein S17
MEEKVIKKSMLYAGEVVSDKMDKTIVVNTKRTTVHPVFRKTITVHKKYKVHDEKEEARIGDLVEFREGRPKSKEKYMYLTRIIKTA